MPSENELREQLRKQAAEIIEAILANRKPGGENSLRDIERLAIRAGQGFEERVLEYLAQEEGEGQCEAVCEDCGKRMSSRGKRSRQIISEAGEVKVERRYYVCPQCGKRSFPPR